MLPGTGTAARRPTHLQRRLVWFRAERQRLAAQRESGQFVRVEDVKKTAFEAARRVRDRMMSIPTRFIPMHFAPGPEAEAAYAKLTEEITLALRELSHSYRDEGA